MTDRYIYHVMNSKMIVFFSSRKIFTKPGPKNGSACGKSAMPPEFRWSK